jgi:hypothetical protein
MSDDTVWLISYEDMDVMDSHNWRKREAYASDNLEDTKRIYAIYCYSNSHTDFQRNERLKEVKTCNLNIPIERL